VFSIGYKAEREVELEDYKNKIERENDLFNVLIKAITSSRIL
jgi:hypothetical protein